MISIVKYTELTGDQLSWQKMNIRREFGHIPIVVNTSWATPDWAVMKYQDDVIVSFYNIIERRVTLDGEEVQVMGINNVITPKEYRGQNYAFDLLKKTQLEMLDRLHAGIGLLLCADQMTPFYSRLNWYPVASDVYFEQNENLNLWQANTMLLSRPGKAISPKSILLNGLPW
jgi:hypothetical protein